MSLENLEHLPKSHSWWLVPFKPATSSGSSESKILCTGHCVGSSQSCRKVRSWVLKAWLTPLGENSSSIPSFFGISEESKAEVKEAKGKREGLLQDGPP